MLNVALTGNVAAGKSTVLSWFAEWGASVIDADLLVKDVEQPGSQVLARIAERFGKDLILPDGRLDRPALRRRAFADSDSLAALNAIVHPAVQAERTRLASEALARGDCILVNDIPLLFEVMDPASFDLVVLVDAPAEVRRQRLMELRGFSSHEADQLMSSQLPAHLKRSRSHIVLKNHRALDDLRRAASIAWKEIRSRAAKKLTPRPGPLLAVMDRPGDEAVFVGGTLARYRDAGCEVSVISLHGLDGPAAGRAIAEKLKQHKPVVLITLDREMSRADREDRKAALLTLKAWQAAGRTARLFYATDHELDSEGMTGKRIAARLDVRPWSDLKAQAIAAYSALAGRTGEPVTPPAGWECYGSEAEPSKILFDLYA